MNRLGIIGSSGGSAFIAANHCFKIANKEIEWVVVTDRDCALGRWARSQGYTTHQLSYSDADTFSLEACNLFRELACEEVLLFYSRRVAPPLIDDIGVWNIHPSLLPAFPGMHAVEQAVEAGARLLGATLHKVDFGLDTGPIVAQVATTLAADITIEYAKHLSYLQKVWLVLKWYEQLTSSNMLGSDKLGRQVYGPGVELACPGLADEQLISSYIDWVAQEERTGHLVK